MLSPALSIILPATIAFVVGIIITPIMTHFLYKHEMWKKKAGKRASDGTDTPIFNELHKHKEIGTPRMGGIMIWLSAFITLFGIWVFSRFAGGIFENLDILSRSQTWIPFATLLIGAYVGLIDDFMEIRGTTDNHSGGLSSMKRLFIATLAGALCGLWFYMKLDIASISFPLLGMIYVGIFIIPIYAFVTAAIYSSGVIDGLDGLAGGVFAVAFAAYSVIAFYQNQIDLAGFAAVITGAILAFLWFNIPPARFYMSETGSMALTLTLAVVAFMTDTLGDGYGLTVLPIIALPLVLTIASVVIQKISKKLRKKKVFLVAPVHHHFEAVGWPSYKVTMRYWIVAVISGFLGIIIAVTLR
jgi:phospho-N-acetylmuramoyl-pentapeptide-transferase